MSNAEIAKNLYTEICSISGFRLGPSLLVDDATRCKLDSLRPSLLRTLSEIEILEERVARVPSPWHAALMMMVALEYSTPLEGQPLKQGGETVMVTSKQRPVFRGQGDKSWDLIPKLERKDVDQVFETSALNAFCALLGRLFKSTDVPTPPAQAHIATAQHYGIATHLLDFSADPSVAVWFAAHGTKKREDQEAAVFVLPLTDALNRGAKIVLPPPFVKRLYIQRGLFIEAPERNKNTLREACKEIRFPLDSTFDVMREGQAIDLCAQDPWLEKAVEWARRWAKAGEELPTDPEVAEKTFYEAFAEMGYPKYLRRGYETMEQVALWVDFTSDMFYWLGALIVDRDKEWLNATIIDAIMRDNRSLIEMCASLFEAEALGAKKYGQEKFASERSHYVKLLRDALDRMRR